MPCSSQSVVITKKFTGLKIQGGHPAVCCENGVAFIPSLPIIMSVQASGTDWNLVQTSEIGQTGILQLRNVTT